MNPAQNQPLNAIPGSQPAYDPKPQQTPEPVTTTTEPLPQTYVSREMQTQPAVNVNTQVATGLTTSSVVEPPDTGYVPKKSGFKKVLLGILLLVFVLLIGGTSYGAYAVAYEKIKLTQYPDIQKKVSEYVISLPFMPKTPKFLLARSAYVHQNVTKESFDISLAVDSQDLVSQLGLSGLDLQAKGSIDYSDTKNVKVNINASVTKDFNIELLKKDKFLYFKINKIPQILLTGLGLKSDDLDPLLNKWVSYDTTPLNTEARKSLEDKEVDPLSEQYVDQEFQKYLDEKVLSKMVIKETKEDGFNDYEISLTADADLIDYLGKKLDQENQKNTGASLNVLGAKASKLSDTVKSLTWKIYIDKKDYYMRKLIITSDLEVDSVSDSSLYLGNSSTVPKTSKAKIAFAAKFGDFGKEFDVASPTDSITSEQFLDQASEIIQKAYGSSFESSSSTASSARDARRQADLQILRSGLELYRADSNKYPATLKNLSPTYISEIPIDPLGTEYFYKPSKDSKSYDLCANLESIHISGGTSCPDQSYNYHVKNP